MSLLNKIQGIKTNIQTDSDLIRLGFVEHKPWYMSESERINYILKKDGIVFRALFETNNGSPYVQLGVVKGDIDRGIVDRWRDCCSHGSVEKVVNNICSMK